MPVDLSVKDRGHRAGECGAMYFLFAKKKMREKNKNRRSTAVVAMGVTSSLFLSRGRTRGYTENKRH